MDTYELLLKKCGFDTAGLAFLWYVIPVSFEDRDPEIPSANVVFDQSIQLMETSADRAMAQVEAVHRMVMDHTDRSKPPTPGNSCEYCQWAGR
jgi:hypothetical protein